MTTQPEQDEKRRRELEQAQAQWLEVELTPAVENRDSRRPAQRMAVSAPTPQKPQKWYMEGMSEEELASQPEISRRAVALGTLLLVALGLLVVMAAVMILVTFGSRIF